MLTYSCLWWCSRIYTPKGNQNNQIQYPWYVVWAIHQYKLARAQFNGKQKKEKNVYFIRYSKESEKTDWTDTWIIWQWMKLLIAQLDLNLQMKGQQREAQTVLRSHGICSQRYNLTPEHPGWHWCPGCLLLTAWWWPVWGWCPLITLYVVVPVNALTCKRDTTRHFPASTQNCLLMRREVCTSMTYNLK